MGHMRLSLLPILKGLVVLIAILSDIHANFQALEAVLSDMASYPVGEIISLGDNIGYGPEPAKVIQTLQRQGVISVMGNHEWALANSAYFARLNPDPRQSLEIQLGMLDEDDVSYCTALPQVMLRHQTRFVHGCPPRSITSYLIQPSARKMERIFSGYEEDIAFFGHLHSFERFVEDEQGCRQEEPQLGVYRYGHGGRYLFNPGSVGQPRDSLNRLAKYGLWERESKTFELRAVAYDSDKTKALLQRYGFPEMNGMRL